MSTAHIALVTGERIEVQGSLEEVAKTLENATRSSAGALAWFTETSTGEALGLNPAHVVTLRAGSP